MDRHEQFQSALSTRSLTTLLNQINGGSDGAFGRLVDAVYDDLRRVAAVRMRREFDRPLASLTESPTAIVHEAVLKLRHQHVQWKDRDHFFAIATRLIGYVIGDYKDRRLAAKRGHGRRGGGCDGLLMAQPAPEQRDAIGDEQLDTLGIIQALHERYPRKAEVVTLHILAGHPMPKIAQMLGISLPTAERDWKFAKAWMRDHLDSRERSI
jgi:RNA polymerase sigma factor (TIGR02999 family)